MKTDVKIKLFHAVQMPSLTGCKGIERPKREEMKTN